jgi:hypothetical protein
MTFTQAAAEATLSLLECRVEMKIYFISVSILRHHEKSIKIVIYLLKKKEILRRKAFIHHFSLWLG